MCCSSTLKQIQHSREWLASTDVVISDPPLPDYLRYGDFPLAIPRVSPQARQALLLSGRRIERLSRRSKKSPTPQILDVRRTRPAKPFDGAADMPLRSRGAGYDWAAG